MPSNQELQVLAEDLKSKGNKAFQKSEIDDAVQAYSQALVQVDRITVPTISLKATILSNRAACYLKQAKLQECNDDCTSALSLLDDNGADNATDAAKSLRSKVLYRRAKSLFLKANMPHKKEEEDLNLAAKDLLLLLSFDSANKEATKLLNTIRAQHAAEKKSNNVSNTPMAKTLREIEKKDDKLLRNLKVLMGLLTNDVISSSMDFGRRGGVGLLLGIIKNSYGQTEADVDGDNDKIRKLSLQCLSCAGSYPLFCRKFLSDPEIQNILCDLVVRSCDPNNIDDPTATGALTIYIRLILHLDRDAKEEEIDGKTLIVYGPLLQCIIAAFKSKSAAIIRAAVDVLSSWTAGKNREMAIRASLTDAMMNDIPVLLTPYEQHLLKPKDLSAYKQRLYHITTRDEAWAFERATLFCQKDGLQAMLDCAVTNEDSNLRREITAVLAKVIASLADDAKMQGIAKPILGTDKTKKKEEEKEEDRMGPIIEEITDEEAEKIGTVEDVDDDDDESDVVVSLEVLKQRAELATSLLMTNSVVGSWSMGSGWPNCEKDLHKLVASGDINALRIVAELLSSAASVKETRPMVAVYLNNDEIKALVTHTDRNVRTATASAIAKLGLAEEHTQDFEIMGLLEAACYMLEEGEEAMGASNEAKKNETKKQLATANIPISSGAKSSVERGVEVITYLITKTIVKEEVAHGFGATSESKNSALELLVKVSEAGGANVSAFGIASIFQLMAATPLTLRKESFEGKEITMEQYDEIQRMQKTQEEKEVEPEPELKEDNDEQCAQRIVKMTNAGVPRALIQLTEGSSDQSLEQIVLALNRMANVQSVRGTMIQQGVLSALIKLEKHEKNPTDIRKKIIRMIRHCMAKLLVTINPSLLTSAQSMGAIKPLIQLVREIESKDLQKFEALLSLTNLASMGDSTKNKIASEKGISSVKFAMFSDHPMVKKAATECLCNMVGNEKFMKTLQDVDELRLWLALAADHEDHYECARAAAGCLAMAAGDPTIANTLIKIPTFKERMDSCMQSGSLEIIHRIFVVILNLVEHGGDTKDAAVEHGLVAFCNAYIDSYHDGKMIKELGLEDHQIPAFNTTVEIAKEVVKAAEREE